MSFWNPFERIERKLRQVLENEKIIIHNQFISSEKYKSMSVVLDNLTSAVGNLTASVATTIALLQKLVSMVGPDESVAIQTQIDLLTGQIVALNDGVAANQPPVVG